jgi:hypothetical protein
MTNLWAQQATDSFETDSTDSVFLSGSEFLANIEKISWEEVRADYQKDQGEKLINVQFRNCGQHYNNLVQFMKLKVMSPKQGAAERAVKFLCAIDGATGAGIMGSGQAPTNEQLQACIGKPLIYKLDTWNMNGNEGNHVNGIRTYMGEEPPKPTKRPKREQTQQQFTPPPPASPFGAPQAPVQSSDMGDDIPFS